MSAALASLDLNDGACRTMVRVCIVYNRYGLHYFALLISGVPNDIKKLSR